MQLNCVISVCYHLKLFINVGSNFLDIAENTLNAHTIQLGLGPLVGKVVNTIFDCLNVAEVSS